MTHIYRTAIIPAGAGVSAPVDVQGDVMAALTLPAALTTATQLVLEHSWDGSTGWGPLILWPDTTQLVIPFVAAGTVLLPAGQWATLGWLRIVAGTSASPVAQAADRLFRLGRRHG